MGMAACNVLDRLSASVGELAAVAPAFQAASDVPNGGVLFALPALLAVGLLHQAHRYFQLPKGYYGLESLFLMLAFLALARLPSLEQLRYPDFDYSPWNSASFGPFWPLLAWQVIDRAR